MRAMRVCGSSYKSLFSLARVEKAVEQGAKLGLPLLLLFAATPAWPSGNALEPEPGAGAVFNVAFIEGQKLLAERKWAEAVIAFRSVLNGNPDFGPATFGLARALVFSGRREEALGILIRASEKEKKSRRQAFAQRADVFSRIFLTNATFQIFQEGVNYLTSGKYRLARERFARALDQEPDNVEVLVRMGQALVLDRDHDSAAERLRLARRLNPVEPMIRVWLGRALHQRGENREAVSELRLAVAGLPESEPAVVWLAEAMVSGGQRPGALRLLEDHVKKRPYHLHALVELGRLRFLFSGRDKEAVWAARKDLQVALSRFDQEAPAELSTALVEHGLGLPATLWQTDLKADTLKLMQQIDGKVAEQIRNTELPIAE